MSAVAFGQCGDTSAWEYGHVKILGRAFEGSICKRDHKVPQSLEGGSAGARLTSMSPLEFTDPGRGAHLLSSVPSEPASRRCSLKERFTVRQIPGHRSNTTKFDKGGRRRLASGIDHMNDRYGIWESLQIVDEMDQALAAAKVRPRSGSRGPRHLRKSHYPIRCGHSPNVLPCSGSFRKLDKRSVKRRDAPPVGALCELHSATATVSLPPSARPRLEAVRVKALGKEGVEDHGHRDIGWHGPAPQSEVLRDVELELLG
jgi:hypothetical protein